MAQLHRQDAARAPGFGLINTASLMPLERQRRLLEAAGCDFVFDVSSGSTAGGRVNDLLGRLGAGSQLFIVGIEAFNRGLPEALRILAGLAETGVEIRLVEPERTHAIEPTDSAISALRAVSAFALAERSRTTTVGGRPAGGTALSKVQLKFARQLYDAGESLRTIGLICRASPDTVWAAIDNGRTDRR